MLTSMVKYPKGAHHGKDALWRRVARWVGGAIVVAALVLMVVGLAVMMFKPDLGVATKEGDFAVIGVEESTAGFRAEERAVAAAVISIEGQSVRLPLRADNRAGVDKGRTLHARYTLNPRVGVVSVESWHLVEPAGR